MAIILCKDVSEMILLYFGVGLCSGGFMTMATYLCEFFPEYYQNLMCTLLNSCDASVMILHSLYYRYVNKSWLPLHWFGFFASIFLILATSILPESPKYLYAKKQYSKAREIIIKIARINLVDNHTYIFENTRFDNE